jgi:polysaccharide export outer membrane protein
MRKIEQAASAAGQGRAGRWARVVWLFVAVFGLALAILPATCPAAEEPPTGLSSYVIGPGDVLEISVWKDEALSRQVVVLPSGKISFPLVGEVVAAGKTVTALQEELTQRITRYVPDPVLTVGVQQVNSLMIYVIGRVNHPGRFVLNTEVNVLQALAMAGGLNQYAKKGKILIFRETGGQTQIFNFDYGDVAGGTGLEQNIRLARGDVIVVH